MKEIINEINRLKSFHNAIILAHNYQIDEIQNIADFVGDSLELARAAAQTDAKVLVVCGVYFMAETAAILNPRKTVLIPDKLSGCPLADMITAEQLRKLKARHPDVPVVCYINSSAEVKAEADICCTSSNAIKVVESLKSDTVIFAPDRNLGNFVQSRTKKRLIIWDGFCPTHDRITAEEVRRALTSNPHAIFLAHPECRTDVLAMADEVLSTSGMLRYVKNSDKKIFIIGTEMGILFRLQKENPDKTFYVASTKLICPNMKKNNLVKVHQALTTLSPQITVNEEIRIKAAAAITKMLEIK